MPAPALIFVVLAAVASFLESSRLLVVADDCPLDMSWSNFTWAASACSIQNERAKCCRYLNAFVTLSVARYANSTGNFGVPLALNDVCLNYVTQTFLSNGIPHNATLFCGIGPKIHVSYQCQGITSGSEFLQTPYFDDVIQKCKMPLSLENSCRRCVNSSIIFLHHLIGAIDNVTLNTCRDAAFVALANLGENASAIDLASCFFSIKELQILPVIAPQPSSQQISPALAPTIASAEAPQQLTGFPIKQHRGTLRLGLFPGIGITVTSLAIVLVIVLVLLIRKKSGELKSAETTHSNTCDVFHQSHLRKYQEGSSIICQRFRYNEIKKATNNFSNIIGRGGFGTVYKAQFAYGTIAAVKRMNPVAENHKRVFCREMELHSRLHHRHLVAFRGFCVERCERFLVYEYMENGSLKDYLHSSEKTPLTWEIRIQIAIDVANALEYLHFYCDPPLCHRDIKSSNILLDKNFLAKVADFGLAHASTRDESVTASSVKLYIHGTPGYVDPEYVVTRQLTEKSDVYSYGMLLLELVTGRHAIHDNRNLIEWSQEFIETNSTLFGLVDPKLGNTFDEDQLEVVIRIVKWCTQREGSARPSMKQVLRLLHESLNPLHGGFVEAMEDEGRFSVRMSGKGFTDENEVVPYSDDGGICLQSSSSTTTRSFCSRSVLLDCGSPQSPSGITSI